MKVMRKKRKSKVKREKKRKRNSTTISDICNSDRKAIIVAKLLSLRQIPFALFLKI